MADYDLKLDRDLVSSLLSDEHGFARILETILNQVLEAQALEQVGADRYERSDERQGYRNGYRARKLFTRVGPVTLRVPQLRDGSFSTEIFRRYQRSEQALVLAMMEMVVNGVSTRKVSRITEELCGTSFSRSLVSQLCMELDGRVAAFNERRLGSYPFVIVDAMYLKARQGDAVQSHTALLVSGVNSEGRREVLGVRMGDSESEAFWLETFRWLRQRGLTGVHYVVSDNHNGLVQAARRCFQGSTWQHCQVHLMRNVLQLTSSRHRGAMSEGLKRIFESDSAAEARQRFEDLADEMDTKAARAIECLENGLEDALSVMALPRKYRRRLRSTNMQERLIEEVRRRERVIRIFPNVESAHRMIGAVLAEMHENWMTRRYFKMDEFYEWLAEQTENEKLVTLR